MYRMSGHCGGIGMRLVLLVLTLVVVAGSIVFLLTGFQRTQTRAHRKALAIAEYGLQEAMMKLSTDPLWSGVSRVDYDDGWYSASVTRERRDDSLVIRVEATGHSGSATAQSSATAKLPSPPIDSLPR